MNDKTYKQVILNRIAIELYKGIEDKEQFGKERMNEINKQINNSYMKLRKHHIAIMKNIHDKKAFEYAKHVIYRLVLLVKYLDLPYDEVTEKFIQASRKDEKGMYDYLVYSLEKYGGVENLNPDDDHDIYNILIHVLDAMGIKISKPLIDVKPMKFIRTHSLLDLANVCGVLESYKQNRIGTMRKINEILEKK